MKTLAYVCLITKSMNAPLMHSDINKIVPLFKFCKYLLHALKKYQTIESKIFEWILCTLSDYTFGIKHKHS